MESTLLNLEGKCCLLLEKHDKEIVFFCDGFNVKKVLALLPKIDKINLSEFFLEIGEGESYKSWERKDFDEINSLSDLMNILSTFPPEIYIFNLKFASENLSISIHDNRHLNISTTTLDEINFTGMIKDFLSKIFHFSDENCSHIISTMNRNNNKYVTINDKGDILNVYESFDDYVSADKG